MKLRSTSCALALLIVPGLGYANSIIVTESAIGSGSLGSNSFSNSLLTLTATGDTSNVVNVGGLYVLPGITVAIDVATLGTTANLTDKAQVFDNQPGPIYAGIIDTTVLTGGLPTIILDTFNSAFSSYALTTSIGPIQGTSGGVSGVSFNTNQGSFVLSSLSNNPTFTASVASAPEHATPVLLGLGMMALAALKRRR